MQPLSASTTRRRFTALVLAFLFLLQSAAQAGSGCLPSVLGVRCCCASAELAGADVERAGAHTPGSKTQATAIRSCCAAKLVAHDSRARGPMVEPSAGCRCELAPVPNAPSDAGTSWARAVESDTRVANWLAHDWVAVDCTFAHDIDITAAPPLSSPPGSPPRIAATRATTRLAQRGVIGLLSDLGTFLE